MGFSSSELGRRSKSGVQSERRSSMRPFVRDAEDDAEHSVGQTERTVFGPEAHVQ